MASDADIKYPTWKWILMLAITIIAFLGATGIRNTDARINSKLDKEVYEAQRHEDSNDIKDLKETMLKMQIELMKNTEATNNLTAALIFHDAKIANFLKDRR